MTRLESIRRTVGGVEVELVRRTEDPPPEPEAGLLALYGLPAVWAYELSDDPVWGAFLGDYS